jgi:hypothetical protein
MRVGVSKRHNWHVWSDDINTYSQRVALVSIVDALAMAEANSFARTSLGSRGFIYFSSDPPPQSVLTTLLSGQLDAFFHNRTCPFTSILP